MKPTIKDHSAEKALLFLKHEIEKESWQKGSRLPVCRELARKAHVSIDAMITAITTLKNKKVLTSHRKRGIFLGGPDESVQKPGHRVLKWETIKDQLKMEILEGTIHDHEFLPSYKELQEKYRASYALVKQATISLVKEGFLAFDKRQLRIRRFFAKKQLNTVYFFMSPSVFNYHMWSIERSWMEQFTRKLEKECSLKNIRLVKLQHTAFATVPASDIKAAFGIIVWHSWNESLELFEFLKKVIALKKPTAVMKLTMDNDAEIIPSILELARRNPNVYVRTFSDDEQAGYRMGRFLFDRGYKKICYFAYQHTQSWAENRYNGLRRAYKDVNNPQGVIPFFHCDFSTIELDKCRDEKDRNAESIMDNDSRALDKTIAELAPSMSQQSTPFIERLRYIAVEHNNGNFLKYHFSPLFSMALQRHAGAAWVCSEDYLASFAAMKFLKDKKIQVPGQIGLASFNDQIESALSSITSYHYDYESAVLRILNFFTYPQYAKRGAKTGGPLTFELDGMVIDRGSV